MDKPIFRQDINALRAFAVLAVIAYHFDIIGFGGGFVGVDIFFVISGFLITSQIQQSLVEGKFSFTNFYASRLRRIVPALAVMCIAILVFGWFYIFPNDYITYAKNAFQALYFGSNQAFGKSEGGGYFDAVQTSVSPFLHTWSLSVEGQFYLILPILWVLIYKRWRNWQTGIVFAILTIALAYFGYDIANHTAQSFYSLPVRAWEFLIGACLVVLPMRCVRFFDSKKVANISSVAGLSCIFLSVHFINVSLLWPSGWTLLPILGAILVLLGKDAASSRWLIHNWFVQRTGDLSYSLYLWHWPVIVFAKHFINAYNAELNAYIIVALLCATVAASYVSWRFIEKPVRINRKFWTNKKTIYSTILIMLIFWGAWRVVSLHEGIQSRFSQQIPPDQWHEMNKVPSDALKCLDEQQSPVNKDLSTTCKFSDNDILPIEVVAWGDSHMHHYFPGLRRAAMDTAINGYFFTRAACHATLSGEPPMNRYSNPNDELLCIEFNSFINKILLNNKNIKTVILGRKWLHGESVDQTIALSRELVKQGKRVILIGAIPKPEFHITVELLKRRTINSNEQKNISLLRSKTLQIDDIDTYVKKELAIEIKLRKVTWIEAMSHFCDKETCYFVKDGVKNFWDASHITESKALEFTEEFKHALKQ